MIPKRVRAEGRIGDIAGPRPRPPPPAPSALGPHRLNKPGKVVKFRPSIPDQSSAVVDTRTRAGWRTQLAYGSKSGPAMCRAVRPEVRTRPNNAVARWQCPLPRHRLRAGRPLRRARKRLPRRRPALSPPHHPPTSWRSTSATSTTPASDPAPSPPTQRPALDELLDYARTGDTLTVWPLDRLGRSLGHLVQTGAQLHERGIGFRSLTEVIDTTTPGGRMLLEMFGALTEFERDLIRERTLAGPEAARSRGRVGGPPTVVTADKRSAAAGLLERPGATTAGVARAFGISRASLRRHLDAQAQCGLT